MRFRPAILALLLLGCTESIPPKGETTPGLDLFLPEPYSVVLVQTSWVRPPHTDPYDEELDEGFAVSWTGTAPKQWVVLALAGESLQFQGGLLSGVGKRWANGVSADIASDPGGRVHLEGRLRVSLGDGTHSAIGNPTRKPAESRGEALAFLIAASEPGQLTIQSPSGDAQESTIVAVGTGFTVDYWVATGEVQIGTLRAETNPLWPPADSVEFHVRSTGSGLFLANAFDWLGSVGVDASGVVLGQTFENRLVVPPGVTLGAGDEFAELRIAGTGETDLQLRFHRVGGLHSAVTAWGLLSFGMDGFEFAGDSRIKGFIAPTHSA